MSRSRPFLTGVALAAILMLGAAAPAAPPPDEDPPVITLTATDFAFEAPERMPAGAVTVKLVNEGESTHHAQLVELRDGKTLDDLMAAAAEGAPPEWAVWVGGPGIAMPGMTSEATVDLRPGTYYWLCFIETDEGVPHLAEGMTHRVEVEPGPRTPLPAPDNTMMLNDYEFKLGHPVEAGHSVIRVRNYAAQPHEVVLVKLMPGKTMDDVMAFFEAGGEGDPPGLPIGGIQALSQGLANNLTVDLEPGDYGLVCFVPDIKDGQPHVAHGMVTQFTVE